MHEINLYSALKSQKQYDSRIEILTHMALKVSICCFDR